MADDDGTELLIAVSTPLRPCHDDDASMIPMMPV
jgi:hypothetical protein